MLYFVCIRFVVVSGKGESERRIATAGLPRGNHPKGPRAERIKAAVAGRRHTRDTVRFICGKGSGG